MAAPALFGQRRMLRASARVRKEAPGGGMTLGREIGGVRRKVTAAPMSAQEAFCSRALRGDCGAIVGPRRERE